jgi:hypothetical protein
VGEGGVFLRVHVQPRASRSEVAGRHGDALKVRLRAPPVDGAANEELMRFMADALGLRRDAVTLVSGATSRVKRLFIRGISPESIAALY